MTIRVLEQTSHLLFVTEPTSSVQVILNFFPIQVEFWLAWNIVMDTSCCVLCFFPTKLFDAVEMEGCVEGGT